MEKKFLKRFMTKTNQTESREKKVERNENNQICAKWKGYDNWFNSWQTNKISLYKISYYPEPESHSRNKIDIEFVYLCNKMCFRQQA